MVVYSASRDGRERKDPDPSEKIRYDTPFNKPPICIFMSSDRSRNLVRRKLHCVKCGLHILDTSSDPKTIVDAPSDGDLNHEHFVEVRCSRSGCAQHYRIYL